MPDFHKWAINITGLHCVYRLAATEEALEQAFQQGRVLGSREAICTTQEWWEEVDDDIVYHNECLTQVVENDTIIIDKPEDK